MDVHDVLFNYGTLMQLSFDLEARYSIFYSQIDCPYRRNLYFFGLSNWVTVGKTNVGHLVGLGC